MAEDNKAYIVYNGDADGLCAANQYLLEKKSHIELISGVKRDIALLDKIVTIQSSHITVFDIAVKNNLSSLKKLLGQHCKILWFDHHISAEIPQHSNLTTHIDTRPTVNTSSIVYQYFQNRFHSWAVAGLFGDNLHKAAYELAQSIGFNNEKTSCLKELGELLNYNAYGASVEDLYYDPECLLPQLNQFVDALDFIKSTSIVSTLREGLINDMNSAISIQPIAPQVFILPDEKWSRRVIGHYANSLVKNNPDLAYAVLVKNNSENSYVVSIRSPSHTTKTAASFCLKFPTGGGRSIAAGINHLPFDQFDDFVKAFCEYF
jgi:hypothetical protein